MSVTRFTHTLIDDSASHGDQAEKYVPHPNENEYHEESDFKDDEYRYENINNDKSTITLDKWRINFDNRFAENRDRVKKDIEVSKANLRKSFKTGVKSLQTLINRSINYFLKTG